MGALIFALSLLLALSRSSLAVYRRTESYEGQVLLKCDVIGKDRIQLLVDDDSLDVWAIRGDGSAEVRVSREVLPRLYLQFPWCSVAVEDMEAFVREAEAKMTPTRVNASWFEEYHEYGDIVNWYMSQSRTYPDITGYVESIGKSVENRDMPALHISSRPMGTLNKIYFQCQIHAREWISGATCMYIADYLLKNYRKEPQVTELLDALEFIFVPFVNPDGYAYTWSNDRLWRKNRRKGTICDGVDLNRNYDDHWGGGGSSSNSCSETYRGPRAASEPETQHTTSYFKAHWPIIGAIDWHSYSQLILRPYGWTREDCPDEKELKELGDQMHDAALAVHGQDYTSEKSVDLYITTGTASDWFYTDEAAGESPYRAAGYTIELRDTGRYGFLLPPDQIIPTGEEMVPTVITFAQYLRNNPLPIKH